MKLDSPWSEGLLGAILEQAIGSREWGAGSRQQGAVIRVQGAGSWEQRAGVLSAGKLERKLGSSPYSCESGSFWEWGFVRGNPGAESRMLGAGSRDQGVNSSPKET